MKRIGMPHAALACLCGLLCAGCMTEDGFCPSDSCAWSQVEPKVRFADEDGRREMARTKTGLAYQLKGVDVSKFPECRQCLKHVSCAKDGCMFARERDATPFRLTWLREEGAFVLQRLSEGRVFGNEPMKFVRTGK